jgi:hypothetical protein
MNNSNNEKEMLMRSRSFAFGAIALALLSSGAQSATVVFGNHEGGLIPWSPEVRNQEFRLDVAQTAIAHCAWYNRMAHLTGVVPGYGNYISFTCRFPPGYDPVKDGNSFWSRR